MIDKQREALDRVLNAALRLAEFSEQFSHYPPDVAVDTGVPEEHERLWGEFCTAVNAARQPGQAEPFYIRLSSVTHGGPGESFVEVETESGKSVRVNSYQDGAERYIGPLYTQPTKTTPGIPAWSHHRSASPLTDRELYLMTEAYKAGQSETRSDITRWLNECIADNGGTVEQSLAYDAERLHGPPMTDKQLTESDINSIDYFWTERGDLERWSDWEEKLPLIRREYPELAKAWDDYRTSIKTLSRIVDSITRGAL